MRKMTIKDSYAIKKIAETHENNELEANRAFIKQFNLEHLTLDELEAFLKPYNEQVPVFTQRFIHKGTEYGFIPNLDDITAGEWIDIENLQNDETLIHELMSILYRPISGKFRKLYHIEKYEGSNDHFLDLPYEYYLGMLVFFYHLNNELLSSLNMSIK